MLRTGHSAACDRVRAQISLELDSELSQLERAMVAAHVVRCAGCRAFRTGVTAVTRYSRDLYVSTTYCTKTNCCGNPLR